jgi:hypothetical protein
MITNTKLAAFAANTQAAPMVARATPPTAGPITLLAFICVELRLMAPGRFSRPTRFGSMALYAGMNIAFVTPEARATRKIASLEGSSTVTTRASPAAHSIWATVTTSSSFLRSTRSATRPPTRPSTSTGPSWANTSWPTNVDDPVRS